MLMIGVFLGSLGFPVIFALARSWRTPRRWSVHVKLTLTTTVILFVLGAGAFLLLEYNNPKTYGKLDAGPTIFQSFFMSMMTRSGGFATIDMHDLNGSSLLVSDMLMFIGGGSASTAGGIKVTTLAVLFLAAFAEARGAPAMEAFGRRIPRDILRLAVSVVLWGATIVAVSSIAILQITKAAVRLRALRRHLGVRDVRPVDGPHRRPPAERGVRHGRHHVHGAGWYSDTRRGPGGQPAPAVVPPSGREAHRWLIGSNTTPRCS